MNPALKKGPWEPAEDVLIVDRQKTMGWADIAKEMGRSQNAIKNRWNRQVNPNKKKVVSKKRKANNTKKSGKKEKS